MIFFLDFLSSFDLYLSELNFSDFVIIKNINNEKIEGIKFINPD